MIREQTNRRPPDQPERGSHRSLLHLGFCLALSGTLTVAPLSACTPKVVRPYPGHAAGEDARPVVLASAAPLDAGPGYFAAPVRTGLVEAERSPASQSALGNSDLDVAHESLQVEARPVGEEAVREEVIRDAVVHVLMAIDAYISGDFPTTCNELDVALDTLVVAELPTGRAGLRFLNDRLPPGYESYNLVRIYREATQRVQATEVPEQRVDPEADKGIGAPQGKGAQLEPEDAVAVPPAEDDKEPLSRVEHDLSEPQATDYLSTDDMAYVRRQIERIVAAFGEKDYPHVETFEKEVAYFIHAYQTDVRGFFERSLLRSVKYMPMVKQILAEKNVPADMAYIAFVESGFRPNAVSTAGAVGLWQFMPKTARAYGLQVDRRLDGRLDPEKATVAAREYFLDLVAIFGSSSFLLSIASYNAGEGKVQYCLKQVDDPFTQRSFWDIRQCLRKETREYVPRIIAAAILAEDPERFGFGDVAQYLDSDKYTLLEVSFPTSLGLIASFAGVSVDELRKINPDLGPKISTTPKDVQPYRILVPSDQSSLVKSELELIASKKRANEPTMGEDGVNAEADEDAKVAENGSPLKTSGSERSEKNDREKRSSGKSEESNHDRDSSEGRSSMAEKVEVGDKTDASKPEKSKAERDPEKSKSAKASSDDLDDDRTRYVKYKAQKGDTISGIATDFGKSPEKVLEWNPYLKKRDLWAGDIVFIYDLDWNTEKLVHKTRKGETLPVVAKKYDVSEEQIQRWNGLSSEKLKSGQTLVIYRQTIEKEGSPASVPVSKKLDPTPTKTSKNKIVYNVQTGNNLSLIAGVFDVNFRDIMDWNHLRGGNIQPGQKLDIYPSNRYVKETYKVKKGDSMPAVAKRYSVDPAVVQVANGMDKSDKLKVGQTLVIYRKAK